MRSLKISTLKGGASGSTRCDLEDLDYYKYCIINVREDGAPVCWIDDCDAMSDEADASNSGTRVMTLYAEENVRKEYYGW